MNKPPDQKSTITAELPSELPETLELTDQNLDHVAAAGLGKVVNLSNTISWSHDDEAPKETVTFEYGGLQVFIRPFRLG